MTVLCNNPLEWISLDSARDIGYSRVLSHVAGV